MEALMFPPASASRRARPASPAPLLGADLVFALPAELEAGEPPEARGLARDQVRLMVSRYGSDEIVHTRFRELPAALRPGDLLVINTSGTLNAALPARLAGSRPDAREPAGGWLALHLSTHLPGDLWIVELRQPAAEQPLAGGSPAGTLPFRSASAGASYELPAGGRATLLVPYAADRSLPAAAGTRLWIAALALPAPLHGYLAAHGFPIRYGYVREQWPIEYYQTVYATEPGSAEMPSAGRAFTPELLTRLAAGGVQIAPLLLHTGVASLEAHEQPYEEWYRVPEPTAELVNAARAAGRRVIAVGTTVVRALETVTDERGATHPGSGWTRLVVTPERGVRAVNGLLTGLHEPKASHLLMLEALAGRRHLRHTYAEALRERYLWHEFGDLHLLLP